ncbi:MAG: branched-chain amino acid transport system substrate-binding protein [Mycobacterium sp.]|nr:branched-chain amino acid transport system substrate-binding protein [Mycobacterium sp.]
MSVPRISALPDRVTGTSGHRSGSRQRRLVSLATAVGCVVLIALASVLIVHLEGRGYHVVAQAQITSDGTVVAAEERKPANPAGSGNAVCPPLSIALVGAITGPDVEAGMNTEHGVRLAVDAHNAANPGCQVQIKEFDTGDDPARMTQLAPQIIADAYTVGVIGPTFSGATEVTGAFFEENGIPAATASASKSTLSEQGRQTFFRAVASDESQGRAVANYLKNTLQAKAVCVIDGGDQYGIAVAEAAMATLGALAPLSCRASIAPGGREITQVLKHIKMAAPDVVLRAGSYAGAPEIARQLRDGGVRATLVSAQGIAEGVFSAHTDDAARGALVSCPCGPAPEWFVREYRSKFGEAPGAYSAEGYDLATIMLAGIDAGKLVRPQMLEWMRKYDGQGVARRYRWTDTGELTNPTIWIYKVQ